ncbi:MAG: hypothetical protein V1873_07985 [Verrucomicrobiota bacterium]
MSKTLSIRLFFAAAVLVLTLSYTTNFLRLGQPYNPQKWQAEVFETYQAEGESDVVKTMEKLQRDGLWSTGGFQLWQNKDVYVSNSGLMMKFAMVGTWLCGGDLAKFKVAGQFTCALLMALALVLFFHLMYREFGLTAAVCGLVLTACSNWLTFVARNIYWMYFLTFLPIVVSFLLVRRMVETGRPSLRAVLVVVGAAVCLRALNGYEYITNVLLSVAVAPLYYGILHRQPWQKVVRWGFLFGVAAALGFLAAFAWNILQASMFYGSFAKGVAPIWGKLLARSFGPPTPGDNDFHDSAPPWVSVFLILHQYLTLPVLSLPFLSDAGRTVYRAYLTLGASIVASVALALGSLATLLPERTLDPKNIERKLMALSVATLWALASGLSWTLLAKGHAFHHLHMNGISFYIPFLLMLYALTGAVLGQLVRRGRALLASAFAPGPIPAPAPAAGEGPANGSQRKSKKNK